MRYALAMVLGAVVMAIYLSLLPFEPVAARPEPRPPEARPQPPHKPCPPPIVKPPDVHVDLQGLTDRLDLLGRATFGPWCLNATTPETKRQCFERSYWK